MSFGESCEHYDHQVAVTIDEPATDELLCQWCGEPAALQLTKSQRHTLMLCDDCDTVLGILYGEKSQPEQRETLEDLAAQRRAQQRPVEVHVTGDFSHQPPKGLDVAKRVAELLTDDSGSVREDPTKLEAGDVAFIRIDAPRSMHNDKLQTLEELSHSLRMTDAAGVVAFAPQIDARAEKMMAARVYAESGNVDRVTKIELHPYDPREMHEMILDSLGWDDAA